MEKEKLDILKAINNISSKIGNGIKLNDAIKQESEQLKEKWKIKTGQKKI